MEWEKCVKMVRLSNQGDPEFYDFVLENLSDIKGQSLEMVINGIELTSKNITEHKDVCIKVLNHIDSLNKEDIGFRSLFRIEILRDLVEDEKDAF